MFTNVPILTMRELGYEVSVTNERAKVFYSFFAAISKDSPREFIPDFLEKRGYEVPKWGTDGSLHTDRFLHSDRYSKLSASGKNDSDLEIVVELDMTGKVNLRYSGKDISGLSDANDLVLEMMIAYSRIAIKE